MEPKILVKPTEKQYQVLQDAFDYFNEALFKDSLPQVMLTLNRERNTFGYFVPSIWTDDKGVEQDHPRSCGKDSMKELQLTRGYGSPPLVRERQ